MVLTSLGALTQAGFSPSGRSSCPPSPGPPGLALQAAGLPPLPGVGFGQGDPLVLLGGSLRPSLGRTRAPDLLGVSSRLGQPLAPSPAPGSSRSRPALCSASAAPVMQVALEARQKLQREEIIVRLWWEKILSCVASETGRRQVGP